MVEIDTDGLAKQNKDTVDLTTLAADTPEVISRQVFLLEFRPFQGNVGVLQWDGTDRRTNKS